jgi:hypothetical protein
VTDVASLQRVIREWVAAREVTVKAANRIIGFGYDSASLAEHRHPARADLDAIPIELVRQSGHFGAANSKALEVAGVTRHTRDPVGGVIRRGPGGEPDGVLEETAQVPVIVKPLSGIGVDGAKTLARTGPNSGRDTATRPPRKAARSPRSLTSCGRWAPGAGSRSTCGPSGTCWSTATGSRRTSARPTRTASGWRARR